MASPDAKEEWGNPVDDDSNVPNVTPSPRVYKKYLICIKTGPKHDSICRFSVNCRLPHDRSKFNVEQKAEYNKIIQDYQDRKNGNVNTPPRISTPPPVINDSADSQNDYSALEVENSALKAKISALEEQIATMTSMMKLLMPK